MESDGYACLQENRRVVYRDHESLLTEMYTLFF